MSSRPLQDGSADTYQLRMLRSSRISDHDCQRETSALVLELDEFVEVKAH